MNEQKLIGQLNESAKRLERFRKLTDNELADLLVSEIWANMNLFTPESDLMSIVVDRLRGDE